MLWGFYIQNEIELVGVAAQQSLFWARFSRCGAVDVVVSPPLVFIGWVAVAVLLNLAGTLQGKEKHFAGGAWSPAGLL